MMSRKSIRRYVLSHYKTYKKKIKDINLYSKLLFDDPALKLLMLKYFTFSGLYYFSSYNKRDRLTGHFCWELRKRLIKWMNSCSDTFEEISKEIKEEYSVPYDDICLYDEDKYIKTGEVIIGDRNHAGINPKLIESVYVNPKPQRSSFSSDAEYDFAIFIYRTRIIEFCTKINNAWLQKLNNPNYVPIEQLLTPEEYKLYEKKINEGYPVCDIFPDKHIEKPTRTDVVSDKRADEFFSYLKNHLEYIYD